MYFPFLCLSILLASVASESLVKVGNFENYDQPVDHGISGEVFVKDEKTLIIKGKACKIVNKPSVEVLSTIYCTKVDLYFLLIFILSKFRILWSYSKPLAIKKCHFSAQNIVDPICFGH